MYSKDCFDTFPGSMLNFPHFLLHLYMTFEVVLSVHLSMLMYIFFSTPVYTITTTTSIKSGPSSSVLSSCRIISLQTRKKGHYVSCQHFSVKQYTYSDCLSPGANFINKPRYIKGNYGTMYIDLPLVYF